MGSAEQLTRRGAAGPSRALTPSAAWAVLLLSTAARSALSVLVVMLLWALVPPVFGMTSTVVMSGSMAPALQVGDVVVARPPATSGPHLGEVLLVQDPDHPGRLRLHRLVGVRDARLQLRGDANPAPDSSLVALDAVRGVAFLRVPLIGLPIVWVRTGDWPAAGAASAAVSVLVLAARTSRLLEGGRRAPARHAFAGAAAVVLLVGGAPSTHAPAWAAFSSSTVPPSTTWASGAFDCLTTLPTIPGMPAPTIAWAFAEPAGATSADLGSNGSTAVMTGSYDRISGSCLQNSGPAIRLGTSGRGVIAASTSVPSPSSLTLSVWFKASVSSGAVVGPGLIAGFGSSADGTVNSAVADRQLLLNADGSLTYRAGVVAGVTASVSTPVVATDGAWHQAVVTMNGALGKVAVAVDGTSVASATLSLSLTSYPAYLRMGADGPSPGTGSYRGLVGRTEMWSGTVATDTQVAALYSAGH